MNVLHLATLAPHEFATYLEFCVNTGRHQAMQVTGSLRDQYQAALNRASVAVAKVRIWAGRRDPSRTITAPINAAHSVGGTAFRVRSVNNASIVEPTDEYSSSLSEALEALSESQKIKADAAAVNRVPGTTRK